MIRRNAFYKIPCPTLPESYQKIFREAAHAHEQGEHQKALLKFEYLANSLGSRNLRTSLDFYVALYHNCGIVQQQLKNYPAARRYYEIALGCRNNLPTFLAFATLKEDEGKLAEARANYYTYTRRARAGELGVAKGIITVWEHNNGRGLGLNNLGIMHYDQKEYAPALSCFDMAKALDPEEAVYYNNSALVLFKEGVDYKTAREHLNIAIMNGFAQVQQYYRRGICLFYEHSFIEAQDDFRQALKLDPNNKIAKEMLAQTNKALRVLRQGNVRTAG